MEKNFLSKEVQKVIENKAYPAPLNLAMASACIMANFKAFNLKVYDVSPVSSLSDYYIIGSATNSIQAKSMADSLANILRSYKYKIISTEGYQEGQWILVDFGDIIVHIFEDTAREIYDLEELWSKYKQVEIPQEFYFSQAQDTASTTEKTDNYF